MVHRCFDLSLLPATLALLLSRSLYLAILLSRTCLLLQPLICTCPIIRKGELGRI